MLKSLQGRLTLLFTAFVLLVLISVGAMMWGLETQRQDALVINLAGRQRMLAQQMARLAYEAGPGEDIINAALWETEQTFDQTLRALLDGGETPYLLDTTVTLPFTRDPAIRSALDEVDSAWNEYRSTLESMASSEAASASLQFTFAQQSDTLVQKADAVVRLYEAASTARVNRLRSTQIAFLACALALLAAGAWITRRSLLKPLADLGVAAKRLGENDHGTPVQVGGPVEMRRLSQAFEEMRSKLYAAREELIQLNFTLEQRVVQRTHELESLNEVSREISSRLDIQQVLNSVTEKARMLLGGEVASLCLVDIQRHWIKLQAVSGPKNAVVGDIMRADEGFADAVLTGSDAMACGVSSCGSGCRMLSEAYRTSHLAAPLRVGDLVIGALCVGSPERDRFAVEAAGMLTKLANVAAIAMENARLFAQAERVATLEERRRVAAEMHDGLGQTLGYLGLMTDQVVEFLSDGREGAALAHLQRTRETIGKASGDVRRAINRLMDEPPAQKDLGSRLKEALDEIASEQGPEADWRLDAGLSLDCSPEVAEQVYNITREALINAARHAHAHRVSVRAGRSDVDFYVTIEDDGQGFDMSQPLPGGHFGLRVMQARAEFMGGRIELQSEPGCGTRITLIWPPEAKN